MFQNSEFDVEDKDVEEVGKCTKAELEALLHLQKKWPRNFKYSKIAKKLSSICIEVHKRGT